MGSVKLIIAGGRDFNDYALLESKCNHMLSILSKDNSITIISGGAKGADSLGEQYARAAGFGSIIMNAKWDEFGKSAGYIRNTEMAKAATHCICFWDGKSRGTGHMINIAKEHNLKLCVITY